MPLISQIKSLIDRAEFNQPIDLRPIGDLHIDNNSIVLFVSYRSIRHKAIIYMEKGERYHRAKAIYRYHRAKAIYRYLSTLDSPPIAEHELLEDIITLPSGEELDIFLERDDYSELSKGNRDLASLFRWLEVSPLTIDDLTLEDIFQDKNGRAIISNILTLSLEVESDSNIEPETSDTEESFLGSYFCNNSYTAVGGWNEGCLVMQDRDSLLFGVVSESEKLVADFIYEQIDDFYEGHAAVMLDGRWGIINRRGEYLLSPEYDDIEMLWEMNFVKFNQGGLYGVMTRDMLVVCDARYRYIGSFYSGRALIEFEDGGYNYIDGAGMLINQERYISAEPFNDSLAKVSTKESIFYIDCNGEFVSYLPTR